MPAHSARAGSVAVVLRLAVGTVLALATALSLHAQVPGKNVNMVAGTTWPDGDPFLQRQNEPSIAASTRNPLHLLAGSNDYRTVDIPAPPDGDVATGDAWLGLYKSFDGGQRWISTLLPGYPQDPSAVGTQSPLHGYAAGADPVVRAGTSGLFYYSGLVFDRAKTVNGVRVDGKSAIFVARFIDNNNQEAKDSIKYLGASVIAKVDPDPAAAGNVPFLDKPWMAVDIPRGVHPPTCNITSTRKVVKVVGGKKGKNGKKIVVDEPFVQRIPAGTVYVAYSSITDGDLPQVRSRIMLTKSTNCGVTWDTPIQVSRPEDAVNQGATIAIDPLFGHVYVAWRRFSTTANPTENAVMVAKLPFGGRRFNLPGVARRLLKRSEYGEEIREFFERHNAKRGPNKGLPEVREAGKVSEFDQRTGEFRFRSNAYPTMTVDTIGRVYVAWAERGFGAARPDPDFGDSRIVIVTTINGTAFTAPAPVDNSAIGHQVKPSLAFAGGKLMLAYYDLRETKAQTFGEFIEDKNTSTKLRHTIDIRAAMGTPGANPVFRPSVQVSQYLHGYTNKYTNDPDAPRDPATGKLLPQQLQLNPPNLPMFQRGTVPFMGDYIDLTPAPAFVPIGRGKWFFNTLPSATPPVFHAVWTDNRDVRPPRDGNWTNYTAPRAMGTSVLDPAFTVEPCQAGNAGSRNQNIYTSRITAGLIAGSPGNAKPLSRTLQRGFVVFAQNATKDLRYFRMRIVSQPPGGRASFDQFAQAALTSIEMVVPRFATATRTVYITSSDPQAIVNVDVTEITALGGAVRPEADGGLASRVVLNPDVDNPEIENPEIENPEIENPEIENAEVYNPEIENPEIENPEIENPEIENPEIENPEIENVVVMNPEIENPEIENADILNPEIENPEIENPEIENTNLAEGAIIDVSWALRSTSNTTAAFNVNLFLARAGVPAGVQTQLLLHKVYRTPVTTANGCDLKYESRNIILANVAHPRLITANSKDPLSDQNDPSGKNASMWLAPGEVGRITLRILVDDRRKLVAVQNAKGETVFVHPELNPQTDIIPAVASQAVSTDAPAGTTEPRIVTPSGSNVFFTQDPTHTLPGAVVTPHVAVQVRNNQGTPVSGVSVTLTLATNPGNAALSGAVALTDANGIATFTTLSVSAAGRGYTLRASAGANGTTGTAVSTLFNVGNDMPVAHGQSVTITEDGAGAAAFFAAGTMNAARRGHPAIKLDDGTVLLAGSDAGDTSAEIFHSDGSFTPTENSLGIGRCDGCAAVKLSNGQVLFAGGRANGTALASAELYDPASKTFRTIEGSMSVARAGASAVLLSTGNVLIVGGHDGSTPHATAELYDPETETFAPTGSVSLARIGVAILLTDGRVLFAGGQTAAGFVAHADLYDPATGVFTAAKPMNRARYGASAVRLLDGRILIVGGTGITPDSATTADLYDPLTDTWTLVGPTRAGRVGHAAVLLPNGTVLVVGGSPASSSAELFDPASSTFTAVNPLVVGRASPSATLLNDGRVLVTGGGSGGEGVLASAEIRQPATWVVITLSGSDTETASAQLFYDIAALPAHGVLSGTPPQLTYTPAPDFHGDDSFAFVVIDRGGPDNCGTPLAFTCTGPLSSAPATVSITVLPLNDAPTFTKGPNQVVASTAGAQDVLNWATNISAGPADESDQALTFVVDAENPSLFIEPPAIAPDGTLTFTPASGPGVSLVTVVLRDDGGTANGGTDRSASQTFTITVNQPGGDDRAPVAVNDSYSTNQDTTLIISAPEGVLANDFDPDEDALEAIKVTAPQHGTVTLRRDGAFVYAPAAGFSGNDSFTYRASDGQLNSNDATVRITIAGQQPRITTVSLREGVLFEGYNTHLSAVIQGPATWTLIAGSLPPGVTLSTSGNLIGTLSTTGTYVFQVRVSDGNGQIATSPPITDANALHIRVSAGDQRLFGDSLQPAKPFGAIFIDGDFLINRRIAQTLTAGIRGDVVAARFNAVVCPAGTSVTAELRLLGDVPPFHPDDSPAALLGFATQTYPFNGPFQFQRPAASLPSYLAPGTRYSLVLSATGACEILRPRAAKTYAGGNAYASEDGSAWSSMAGVLEFESESLVMPDGLTYLAAFRGSHSQTRISDSASDARFLLAAGNPRAEVLDAATGVSVLTPPMNIPELAHLPPLSQVRNDHAAVRLLDGRILVVGGSRFDSTPLTTVYFRSAEIYDPVLNVWTPAGELGVGRALATATLLGDGTGRVLVAGGVNSSGGIRQAELWDPATGTFVLASSMTRARWQHRATPLLNGKILISGGWSNPGDPFVPAELYDAAGNVFGAVTLGATVPNRGDHTATLLATGDVLLTGGNANGELVDSADLYTAGTNTLATIAQRMTTVRTQHAAVLLADGSVLIGGGRPLTLNFALSPVHSTLERYVAGEGFVPAGSMRAIRYQHQMGLISDGRVLMSGGFGTALSARSAEVVTLGGALIIDTASLPDGRVGDNYTATLSAQGGVGDYTFDHLGTLPQGLIRSGAAIFGEPTTPGRYEFVAKATDSAGNTAFRALSIDVNRLVITSPSSLPAAAVGRDYSYVLAATGTGDITWDIVPFSGTLPSWLSLDKATGALRGTPTDPAFYVFTVEARDASFQMTMKRFTLQVSTALTITSTSLTDGVAGQGYGGCLSRNGGSGNVSWALAPDSDTPRGLVLQPGGCFDFNARITQVGTFALKVRATDAQGATAERTLSLRIGVHSANSCCADSPTSSLNFSGAEEIAQTMRQDVAGSLIGFELPVFCSAGDLTVEVRNVLNGVPNTPGADVWSSVLVSGSQLPPYTGSFAGYRRIALTAPVSLPVNQRFALVLRAANGGQCGVVPIQPPDADNTYAYGDGFRGDGASFTRLVVTDPAHPDLPFNSIVDPGRDALAILHGSWRTDLTATRLDVGKVLVAGGSSFGPSAEVYDEELRQFIPTLGEMTTRRWGHTATRLADGRVLIIGGANFEPFPNQAVLASIEIYDPQSGRFSAVGALNLARYQHAATLLDDGRVLVTGGYAGFFQPPLANAELFDLPTVDLPTGLSSGPFAMTWPRARHTATALPDARVLIAGGWNGGNTAEIYTAAPGGNGSFAATGSMHTSRAVHSATLLTSGPQAGKVVIIGGQHQPDTTLAEFYNPLTGTFSAAATEAGLRHPRAGHVAVALADGKVAIIGGYGPYDGPGSAALAEVEIFDSAANEFRGAGTLRSARAAHAGALLSDGSILIVAGWGRSGSVGYTAETYDVAAGRALSLNTPALPDGRVGEPYSATLSAAGTNPPFTFGIAGALPSGLTLTGDTIQGGPQTAGTSTFVVHLSDSAVPPQRTSQVLSITVDRFTIATTNLPNAIRGEQYGHQLEAEHAVGGVKWRVRFGQLPPGLALGADTGRISGVTTAFGGWGFTVEAVDAAGQVAVQDLHIQISTTLQITTVSLPDRYVTERGVPFISAVGGNGQYRFSVTDPPRLPLGITLNEHGGFDGAPLKTGTFTFTVLVEDCVNNSCGFGADPQVDSQALTWRIVAVDQRSGSDSTGPSVTIGGASSQRVAFTATAGTSGLLVGVRLPNLICTNGGPLTASLYPVTGSPAVPNDSGAPLQSVTLMPLEWYDGIFFAAGEFFPLGAPFAIVLSSPGTCTLQFATMFDTYPAGQAFISTGATGGWTGAATPDVPFETLVLPTTDFVWTTDHRNSHVATKLPDGRLLLAGGRFDRVAQIYDTSKAPALSDTGEMIELRYRASATLLASGKVLIVGGERYTESGQIYSATAELYDPDTGVFSVVGGPMSSGRSMHTATLLPGDLVLIAGGFNGNVLQSAEIFDPALNGGAGGFRAPAGAMMRGRSQHTATLLTSAGPDRGKVLLAGGWYGPVTENVSFELFDPATELFMPIDVDGFLHMNIPRARHTATELPDGRVLFVGGQWTDGPSLATHAEVFIPATDGNSADAEIRGAHVTPRVDHTATLLPDGSGVLIAGGVDHANWNNQPSATTETWHVESGLLTGSGSLAVARALHTATVLSEGLILMVGGASHSSIPGTSLEWFDPATAIGVASYTLPPAGVAVEYIQAIVATGGSAPYQFVIVSGALPPGLTLQADGSFRGTPATAGTYRFIVRVTDSTNQVTHETITIEVKATLSITRNILHAIVGEGFAGQLTASGGTTPVRWELDGGFGSVPTGIDVLHGGGLTGVPTIAGHFSFGVIAFDSHPTIQQAVRQRVRISIADRDQKQLDQESVVIAGGMPVSTVLGQVVTVGVSGTLSGIRLPIGCEPGGFGDTMWIEVRDTFNGRPGNRVLLQVAYASGVEAFPMPIDWETIKFPTPVYFKSGEQLSIFFFVPGQCSLGAGALGETYGGGDLFSAPSSYFNVPWEPTGRDLAFQTLVEPVRFANFGSAAADGGIDADEWTSAGQMHFMVGLPGGQATPGTMMVMNDETDVHVAIVYERDDQDANAFLNINSDNDNDGVAHEDREDLWSLGGDGTSPVALNDQVGDTTFCPGSQFACGWPFDVTQGGSHDGVAGVRRRGTVFAFEASHPFNSGDANDISLLVGQRFGFHLNMSVSGTQNNPAAFASTQIPVTSAPVAVTIISPPGVAINLGTLGGDTIAYAINNNGRVTGTSQVSGNDNTFVANANGAGLTNIHPAGMSSAPHAINDAGDVVGGFFNPHHPTERAFLWSPAAGAIELGSLEVTLLRAGARGLNRHRDVVGYSYTTGNETYHAFLWRDGTMTDIHPVGIASLASAINNVGQVTGFYEDEASARRGFLLQLGGTAQDLGTMGPGDYVEPFNINDSGVVVGRASSTPGGAHRPFVWRDGIFTDLTLPGGRFGVAWDVNNAGVVVGESENGIATVHAFIYRNGVLIDLNTLLAPDSRWLLQSAHSINEAGQITGQGILNGQLRAFVLTLAR